MTIRHSLITLSRGLFYTVAFTRSLGYAKNIFNNLILQTKEEEEVEDPAVDLPPPSCFNLCDQLQS